MRANCDNHILLLQIDENLYTSSENLQNKDRYLTVRILRLSLVAWKPWLQGLDTKNFLYFSFHSHGYSTNRETTTRSPDEAAARGILDHAHSWPGRFRNENLAVRCKIGPRYDCWNASSSWIHCTFHDSKVLKLVCNSTRPLPFNVKPRFAPRILQGYWGTDETQTICKMVK